MHADAADHHSLCIDEPQQALVMLALVQDGPLLRARVLGLYWLRRRRGRLRALGLARVALRLQQRHRGACAGQAQHPVHVTAPVLARLVARGPAAPARSAYACAQMNGALVNYAALPEESLQVLCHRHW
jgi:hypothetical protein